MFISLSTNTFVFQLLRGGSFYWWRKPQFRENMLSRPAESHCCLFHSKWM